MYVIYYGRIVDVAGLFLYSCMYCMYWRMYLQPDLCFQRDDKGSMCVSLERSEVRVLRHCIVVSCISARQLSAEFSQALSLGVSNDLIYFGVDLAV